MFNLNIKTIRDREKPKRGIGLLETVLATVVSLVLASQLIQQIQDSDQSIKATNVALKMRTLTDASENYVRANREALMNQMSDNQIVKLPITGNVGPVDHTLSLQNSGVIPADYNFKLPYQQQPLILIRKVPVPANQSVSQGTSRLEAMVTTYGGMSYSDRLLGEIVQKMGARGGAIMNTVFPNVTRGTMQGAYGSWHYQPSSWSTGPYPITCGQPAKNQQITAGSITCGRPVGVTTNTNPIISDFLDRFYIGGNSEANTMHTNIDANDNSFINTNTVDGVSGQPLRLSSSDSKNNVIMPKNLHVCNNIGNNYNCGLILGTNDTTLTNNENGWTTLTQNLNGFHIAGNGNLMLAGALMMDATRGNEYNVSASGRPSGLMFYFNTGDWTVGNGFGAHLFQENGQYLTLSGANGFTGLDLEPGNNQAARIQILESQIYGDNNGLFSLRVGDNNGGVYVTHADGSQADVSSDAINLGTSIANSRDGNMYPAIPNDPCEPNGRLASQSEGHGQVLVCYRGKWASVQNIGTQGKPKFSNLIWSSSITNNYSNQTGQSVFAILRVPSFDDNRRPITLTNGVTPCIINEGGRKYDSGETCSFIIPSGVGLNGSHQETYQSGQSCYASGGSPIGTGEAMWTCDPVYSTRQVNDFPVNFYLDIYQ